MDYKINVGDTIPNFTVKDAEGEVITQEEILGGPFVLYFYPKDDTPGCTKEACSFRDVMDNFEDIEVLVVGVSPDSPSSHQMFSKKHNLNFPLLSDENFEMSRKFDVVRDKEGTRAIERTTFLCDADGTIQWIERPVNVEGHVDRIMHAIDEFLS